MEKRYQVFVSSTYQDLRDERQEVIQALLELDCIPSGMELFPAADEDQWSLIKKVIDDCDYYIVIIAGRYGSLGPDGKSYTQMEYEYAMQKPMPVMAFLHEDRGSLSVKKTDQTEAGREGLERFILLVAQKHCKHWSSAKDLGGVVSRGIAQMMKMKPGVGWVRANSLGSLGSAQEILRLKNRVEELETDIRRSSASPPPGTENLASGNDALNLRFYSNVSIAGISVPVLKTSWNEVFGYVGPHLMNYTFASDVRKMLIRLYLDRTAKDLRMIRDTVGMSVNADNVRLVEEDFQIVKVQLRALGLIEKFPDTEQDKWKLTSYGDAVLMRLVAIPSPSKILHNQ
jgi:hypothetical protein